MPGRKPLQPTKIKYEQAKNFFPERLEVVYDFIFRKTIERFNQNTQNQEGKVDEKSKASTN